MNRWCLLVLVLVVLSACGGPSQYAVNTLYDARVLLATIEEEGVGELAPEALQEAQRYLSQAEAAFAAGKEQEALRLSHYAQRTASYASLQAKQRQVERRARIAEIDLAEAREREEQAFQARRVAEDQVAED